MVNLVEAHLDSLSRESNSFTVPFNLALAIRQWMISRVCETEYLLPNLEQEMLDLIRVECNNLYWLAFGKPIPRQDISEYHDGFSIIRCFAKRSGREKQFFLSLSKNMSHPKYLLSLGVITSVLPYDLAKDIGRLFCTHSHFHRLLQVLLTDNTVTTSLHNLILVAAVLYMSLRDWDSILNTFGAG